MTHEYTLLVGGIVLPGGGRAQATALAYAHDTVLAVGSDAAIRGISRGDSRVVDLRGATVHPAGAGGAVLEPGAPASFRVLDPDGCEIALVIEGRLTTGVL